MAFSTEIVNPSNQNAALQYGVSAALANGNSLSAAPTVAGGALLDCTDATSGTIKLDNGATPGALNYVEVTLANALASAGPTGVVLTSTQAQVKTALLALFAAGSISNGKLSVSITDGTNTILAAQGNWNCTLLA